jgi:hypothetical protein
MKKMMLMVLLLMLTGCVNQSESSDLERQITLLEKRIDELNTTIDTLESTIAEDQLIIDQIKDVVGEGDFRSILQSVPCSTISEKTVCYVKGFDVMLTFDQGLPEELKVYEHYSLLDGMLISSGRFGVYYDDGQEFEEVQSFVILVGNVNRETEQLYFVKSLESNLSIYATLKLDTELSEAALGIIKNFMLENFGTEASTQAKWNIQRP